MGGRSVEVLHEFTVSLTIRELAKKVFSWDFQHLLREERKIHFEKISCGVAKGALKIQKQQLSLTI